MTNKHAEILSILSRDKEMSLIDICAQTSWYYYHNERKYIGEILSRMIRLGLVERTRRGYFKKLRSAPAPIESQRQLSLF